MNKKKMLQFRLVKNTLPFVFISFITPQIGIFSNLLSFIALKNVSFVNTKRFDVDGEHDEQVSIALINENFLQLNVNS